MQLFEKRERPDTARVYLCYGRQGSLRTVGQWPTVGGGSENGVVGERTEGSSTPAKLDLVGDLRRTHFITNPLKLIVIYQPVPKNINRSKSII